MTVMADFAATVGVLFVALVTPGPNNLVVMRLAAGQGPRAFAPAAAGVIGGTLALFFVARIGLSEWIFKWPALQNALLIAGCAYLAWLGLSLIGQADTGSAPGREPGPGSSFIGMALFQWLNPKSWALLLTVAVSSPKGPLNTMAIAVAIAVIAAFCLGLWALAGSALSHFLAGKRRRRLFNGLMGTVLIVFSGLMLAGALR
jgi:threonine/homoserine/homoserine lactone efflux protein